MPFTICGRKDYITLGTDAHPCPRPNPEPPLPKILLNMFGIVFSILMFIDGLGSPRAICGPIARALITTGLSLG
jgi:hypothetical protein